MTNRQHNFHNISIMQKAASSELPLPLQHAVAACCSIIRDYFAARTNSFMLSTHIVESRLNVHMRDFLNQVLLCLNMIKVEIEDLQAKREPSFNRKFNLIVVDGPEALRQMNPAQLSRDYDVQEYYLLYLLHAARFPNILDVFQEMFTYFWQNNIINVSIFEVNHINQTVETFTYYPFYGPQTCKSVYVDKINEYSGTWLRSLEDYIFPEKIENLQQCPLTVAVWNTPPYLSLHKTDAGFYEISDFEADMLEVLAEKINFTFDLREPPNNEQRGKVLANGTTTGALKMLMEGIADLSLGSFRYTIERSQLLTAALPYYQTWQIYGVLRKGNPYTSLEVLVYAFDERSWVCICLSLQVTILITYAFKLRYHKSILARIALGYPRASAPITNIISLFMGQSLVTLPQTNFTRYMIALWLVYGNVLRTGYQAMLFQFLQGNLYHTPPQSLTELIEDRCTLVMTQATFDSVATVPRIEQGLIDVIITHNTSEEYTYYYVEGMKSESQCYAGVSPLDYLTYHALLEKKIGTFYVLPEKVFTQHVTMYFTKHSYLTNRFNFLFMNLRSMGLIDFWASKILDAKFFRNKQTTQFVPVTLPNVKGVFLVYAILVFMAMVIFCVELSLTRIQKNLKSQCF